MRQIVTNTISRHPLVIGSETVEIHEWEWWSVGYLPFDGTDDTLVAWTRDHPHYVECPKNWVLV